MLRKIIGSSLLLGAFLFFDSGAAANAQTQIVDKGDFKIGFAPKKGKKPKSKLDAETRQSLQGLADGLNKTFALPGDVYIALAECSKPNAYYESEKRQLLMCYELYAQLDELSKKIIRRKQSATKRSAERSSLSFSTNSDTL